MDVVRRFSTSAVFKFFLVSFLAGTASFMFMPFILYGFMRTFTASLMGVLISLPLTLYLLEYPGRRLEVRRYFSERRWYGFVVDLLMTMVSGIAPAVVLLYFQLGLGLLPPVPVASSAAAGVFTGYSAFLFRNRGFFRDDSSDIVL